jgi:hypothetical protein
MSPSLDPTTGQVETNLILVGHKLAGKLKIITEFGYPIGGGAEGELKYSNIAIQRLPRCIFAMLIKEIVNNLGQ